MKSQKYGIFGSTYGIFRGIFGKIIRSIGVLWMQQDTCSTPLNDQIGF